MDGGFPLESLPYCAFQADDGRAHLGVGIGDFVLDLAGVAGLLPEAVQAACSAATLNPLMAAGPGASAQLRSALQTLLGENRNSGAAAAVTPHLVARASAKFLLPVAIGNYTDFYASLHHATNVGRLFRPEQPLLPNYKHVPIAYHGRASSVQVSGAPVRRPHGQIRLPDMPGPVFAPSSQLDFELEMGVYVSQGNPLGRPVAIDEADEHLFGFSLLNDWSARDLQRWEAQPLGPFLSKSFLTTVSPWVVPVEALSEFRRKPATRPSGEPEILPYLASDNAGAFDICVEAWLSTAAMRQANHGPLRVARANTLDLYWTFAQMLTHHTSNGCNLLPGDLLGSGTISAPDSPASLLELTSCGQQPIQLPGGESRTFLQEGDEVLLRAYCQQEGRPRISFGECRGRVGPNENLPPHMGSAHRAEVATV